MKKIIPVLGVLAGAAAFAVYKMKKDEQKQIIDLDQGLLDDDDEAVEEGPISDPASCCEAIKETAEDIVETGKEKAKNLEERTEELLEDAVDHIEDGAKAFQIHIEDAQEAVEEKAEDVKETVEDTIETVKESTDQYPHLTGSQVEAIRTQADKVIEELEIDGDVHSHERPVQHKVNFTNMEDLEAFKNTVINKGFVITNGEEAFQLMVLHISAINKETLYENMFYLADTAVACHGTYEGWVSKVVY